MFKAIWKYFRALGYLVTGNINSFRQTLDENVHVVAATFDTSIDKRKNRISTVKDAYERLSHINAKKIATLQQVETESESLTKKMVGAKAKADHIVKTLTAQGKSQDDIKQDAEFKKCLKAYQDFKATLEANEKRIEELAGDVENNKKELGTLESELQSMIRSLDELKEEKEETIAENEINKQRQEVADILSGISTDDTDQDLARIRESRESRREKAKVSQRLAGIDSKQDEAEYEQWASQSEATSEFDDLFESDVESKRNEPSPLPE